MNARPTLPVIALGAVLLATPSTAVAGIWFQSAFSFARTAQTAGDVWQTESDDFDLLGSSTLGYRFRQGFVVGGQALIARSTADGETTWAWGPKGGLLIRGFELTAGYLPFAEHRGSADLSGSGFVINVGYTFPVTGSLRLGVQGTYWSVTFRKQNGNELEFQPRASWLTPLLAVGLDF